MTYRGEQPGRRIRVGRVLFIVGIAIREVVPPAQSRLVHYRPIEKELRSKGKVMHRCAGVLDGLLRAVAIALLIRLGIRVRSRLQLRTAFGDLHRIRIHLALLTMELQPEAIGQQLLQHLLLLAQTRLARRVRRAFNVVTVVKRPVRQIDHLSWMDGISELHQVGEILIADRDPVTGVVEPLAARTRIVQLDRGHSERRMRIGDHPLHRRYGRSSLTQRGYGGEGSGADQKRTRATIHRTAPR